MSGGVAASPNRSACRGPGLIYYAWASLLIQLWQHRLTTEVDSSETAEVRVSPVSVSKSGWLIVDPLVWVSK